MSRIKTECPSCGANIKIGVTTCEFCNSTIIPIISEREASKITKNEFLKRKKELENLASKAESILSLNDINREIRKLGFQHNPNLNSNSTDVHKTQNWNLDLHNHKSTISLEGFEHFTNLGRVNLRNCNLTNLPSEFIDLLKERIISINSRRFVLLLEGCNYGEQILRELSDDFVAKTKFTFPNPYIKSIEKHIEELKEEYYYSDKTQSLKKYYSTFESYLISEITNQINYNHGFLGKKFKLKKTKLLVDKNPYKVKLSGFYKSSETLGDVISLEYGDPLHYDKIYIKEIDIPRPEVIIKSLNESLHYDFSFLKQWYLGEDKISLPKKKINWKFWQ